MIGVTRRRVMGGGGGSLPYDAEVEYLQATGTQWIDLGFKATDNIMFELYLNRSSNSIRFDCGAEDSWTSNIARFIIPENGNMGWQYGESSVPQSNIGSSANYVGDIRVVVIGNTASVLNLTDGHSTYYDNGISQTFTNTGNFLLFGSSLGSSQSTNTAMNGAKLYSAKVKDTGVDLDLIPVRKNGVGYLYDKNSGTLFGKSGTDAFAYGSDVTPYVIPYDAEVEYLESTGTQYADLNIIPNLNLKFNIEVCTSSFGQSMLAGCRNTSSNMSGSFFFYGAASSKLAFAYANTWVTSGLDIQDGNWHGLLLNGIAREGYVDGVKKANLTYSANPPSRSMYVFRVNQPTLQAASSVGKIRRIIVSDPNDTVLADIISVRSNGVGYYYDKVRKIMIGSKVSDQFVYGPDKT